MAKNREELYILQILRDIAEIIRRCESVIEKKIDYQIAIEKDSMVVFSGFESNRQVFGQSIHDKASINQFIIKNLLSLKAFVERTAFSVMTSTHFSLSNMDEFQDSISAAYSMAKELEIDGRLIVSNEGVAFGELGKAPEVMVPWFEMTETSIVSDTQLIETDPSISDAIRRLIKAVESEHPSAEEIRRTKEDRVIKAMQNIEDQVRESLKVMTPHQLEILAANLTAITLNSNAPPSSNADEIFENTKAKVISSKGTYDNPSGKPELKVVPNSTQ